jgi:hypothetical protein
MRKDPVVVGELKRLDREQLLKFNAISEHAGFSGRRSVQWIESKIQPEDTLVVRPLLWENSPRRCLRCSVIFVDREYGLGQLLLDFNEEDFDELPSVNEKQMRALALHLVDHVKIVAPTTPEERTSR